MVCFFIRIFFFMIVLVVFVCFFYFYNFSFPCHKFIKKFFSSWSIFQSFQHCSNTSSSFSSKNIQNIIQTTVYSPITDTVRNNFQISFFQCFCFRNSNNLPSLDSINSQQIFHIV